MVTEVPDGDRPIATTLVPVSAVSAIAVGTATSSVPLSPCES